jgi:hypothetical protein
MAVRSLDRIWMVLIAENCGIVVHRAPPMWRWEIPAMTGGRIYNYPLRQGSCCITAIVNGLFIDYDLSYSLIVPETPRSTHAIRLISSQLTVP